MERSLATQISTLLILALFLSSLLGILAEPLPAAKELIMISGFLSCFLWILGAIFPLYDPGVLPTGLANGAAAVFAMFAIAASVPLFT